MKLTGITINGNVLYGEKPVLCGEKPKGNWKTWVNKLFQPLRKSKDSGKGSDMYNIEIGCIAIAGQVGEMHIMPLVIRRTFSKNEISP